MRVMVMVKATKSSEQGAPPSAELMEEMTRFNEELVKAGIMKGGDGLKPSAQGVRVQFSGKNRTVVDGPFAETKELVAGYWLWEVASMAEAVEWVKRCPNPMPEDSEIEIRSFYGPEDFAEWDKSGDFAAREQAMIATVAGQASTVQPYLFYSGRCAEALEFYKTAIGARLGMVMRFNEAPDQPPPGVLEPGFETKIMHSEFTVGNLTIFASDGCDSKGAGAKSNAEAFRLALTVPTAEDADILFNRLAEGGKVDMPLAPTFWSPRFGMLTDQFGIGWMIMVPGAAP